jgi:hypothetical protein
MLRLQVKLNKNVGYMYQIVKKDSSSECDNFQFKMDFDMGFSPIVFICQIICLHKKSDHVDHQSIDFTPWTKFMTLSVITNALTYVQVSHEMDSDMWGICFYFLAELWITWPSSLRTRGLILNTKKIYRECKIHTYCYSLRNWEFTTVVSKLEVLISNIQLICTLFGWTIGIIWNVQFQCSHM